jgi:hypothetical protein
MRVDRSIKDGALVMKFRTSVLAGIFLGHAFGWTLLGAPAFAISSPPQVLISELQTNGGSGHSGNEFIELYNPDVAEIALDGWKIQYHSASNSDCINGWSSSPKISFPSGAKIKSYGFYLLSATGYLDSADAHFTSGLSDTAGAIRLIRTDLSVSDSLAWGNAGCGTGVPAPSPTNNRSLERRPGDDLPLSGNNINSGDNAQDFSIRAIPEPQGTFSPIEDSTLVEIPAVSNMPVYLPLKLSELLIDPVSPETDSHDEFIELQNPNTEPVNIGGYTLKTLSSQFHLLPQILGPGQFTLITSHASTINLANDGGNIQIFDPVGTLVDESAPWPKASPGSTWAVFTDGWAWTTKQTPGSENILEELPSQSLPKSDTISPVNSVTEVSTYLPLQITELYIDPVSPQTDNDNEYIELFNPNDEPVDSAGYIVKSGSNLGNTALLGHHIIGPHEYLALYSSETKLPLSNSGSTVQLFDPAGRAIGAAISYGVAKTGQAWTLAEDSTWQWSTTLTPSGINVITAPAIAAKAVSAPKVKGASDAKKSIVPKPKVAKPKISKTKKPTTSKAKIAKTSSASPISAALHKTSGHTLILILLGLTICYVIYEFRYDIRHTYHRLRGHTKLRS